MKIRYAVIGLMLCAASIVETRASNEKPMLENGTVTLAVPPAANSEEPPTLRVMLGPLPRGARVVVRSEQGKVLGALSPFGAAAAREGGTYTLPVPAELLARSKLSLAFTLELDRGTTTRVPSRAEVRDVKLRAGR